MNKKILLTGFGPFPGVAVNPSQRIVETFALRSLPGIDLATAILPVDYSLADARIRTLIRTHLPDLVVSIGVASKSDAVRLERVALNLDDSALADNAGLVRRGTPILDPAPAAYFSGLPLPALLAHLEAAGVEARISNHAGAYLCNHVYFAAQNESEQMMDGPLVGLIHVPMAAECDPQAGTPLSDLVTALEAFLSFFAA